MRESTYSRKTRGCRVSCECAAAAGPSVTDEVLYPQSSGPTVQVVDADPPARSQPSTSAGRYAAGDLIRYPRDGAEIESDGSADIVAGLPIERHFDRGPIGRIPILGQYRRRRVWA